MDRTRMINGHIFELVSGTAYDKVWVCKDCGHKITETLGDIHAFDNVERCVYE